MSEAYTSKLGRWFVKLVPLRFLLQCIADTQLMTAVNQDIKQACKREDIPVIPLHYLVPSALTPGKLPAMETSSFNAPAAFIQDGEVGPVPRADTATLGAYLGNSDLVLDEAIAVDQRPDSRNSMQDDFMANLDQLVALSSQRSVGKSVGWPSHAGKCSMCRASMQQEGLFQLVA